ncbi:ARM repeat-containing protein [Wallemia mellicola]|nr:ARM repeat-containing protein [Wallemia mellicola]TIC73172.1 ARM repeat-containing protein [Wallemia mellicola]
MEIDKEKLKSNYGNIYLIKYLNSLDSITVDTLVEILVNTGDIYPTGRLIRNLTLKLALNLDNNGITTVVNELLSKVIHNNLNNKVKASIFFILGEVISNNSGKFSSASVDLYDISLKYLRNTNLTCHLRFHSGLVIAKIIATSPSILKDNRIKDLLKCLKNYMTDKSYPIQRVSTICLLNLSLYTQYLSSNQDIEYFANTCVKAAEVVDQHTRQYHTELVAQLLASTQFKIKQQPQQSKLLAKRQTQKKADKDDNDNDESANAPAVGLMSTDEMLKILSPVFTKGQRKIKLIVLEVYARLFLIMGSSWVEHNYQLIVNHLICNLMESNFNRNSDLLTIRSSLILIFRDTIGKTLLSEQGQVIAMNVLLDGVLSKTSVSSPTQFGYSDNSLVVAIEETVGLLDQLGSVPIQSQDKLPDVMFKLIAHPAFSVQVATSRLFRQFHYLCPTFLEPSLSRILDLLEKKLSHLRTPNAASNVAFNSIGYACAVSSLIGLFKQRPLNTPIEIPHKVFELSQSLLKLSGECEFDQASIHIQVAWILIDSLMSIGPQFTSSILNQLLLLWRNSLSKVDLQASSPKTQIEWTFLSHIRECALSALLAFLKFNASELLTMDLSRKFTNMLINSLTFSIAFNSAHMDLLNDQIPSGACAHPNIGLLDRDILIRRRIFQCAVYLDIGTQTDSLTSLVEAAFNEFGDSNRYAGSAAQATIASNTGSFASIWNVGDGYGYGLTSLHEVANLERNDGISEMLLKELRRPSPTAYEHDILNLWEVNDSLTTSRSAPATGVVDASITLFALRLTDLDSTSMVRLFDSVRASVKNPKLDRNPGRKLSILVNTLVAIVGFLNNGKTLKLRTVLNVAPIRNTLQELFEYAIVNDEASLRRLGAEALGKLIALTADRTFLTSQSRYYMDLIVNNRAPSIRCGSAITLSAIYKQVGSLAAGPLLNTIVDILTSLSSDSHPEVHYYSLEAFQTIVEAAGSAFSPYITRTLGLLASIFNWESHEPEGGQTIISNNIRSEYTLYKVLCSILDAIIGILGPELNEMTEVRELLFLLVKQMMKEKDNVVKGKALKSLQQFAMFAPKHTDIPLLLKTFQSALKSSNKSIQNSAVNGLYQIAQKYVKEISQIGGDSLAENLFGLLDQEPGHDGIKLLLLSWLRQTAEINAQGWLSICQKVFTKAGASNNTKGINKQDNKDADEEVQGLGAGEEEDVRSLSSWQTQLFALECVHHLLGNKTSKDANNPSVAARSLQGRVAELIKLAFIASTSRVEAIRIKGLIILRDVIEVFAEFRDSHDNDASLLEQHQAPITAAITPAFGQDSTPDILALAIQVCATYVRSGIVKDVSKMGRILKLLSGTLSQFKDPSNTSIQIGEMKNLCITAKKMLRVSTLTAWAELVAAYPIRPHLGEVFEPFWFELIPLWAEIIENYAEIRENTANDDVLVQQILLPYYDQNWMKILNAFVTSLDKKPELAKEFICIDGAKKSGVQFQIIYGLAFSTLVTEYENIPNALIALNTIGMLIKTPGSDYWILEDNFFEELLELVWKLTIKSPFQIRGKILGLLGKMSKFYDGKLVDNIEIPSSPDSQFGKSLPKKSKVTRCLQLIYLILSGCLDENSSVLNWSMEHKAYVAKSAFITYLDVSDSLAATTRVELFAVVLHKYAELLKREDGSIHIAAVLSPCLKVVLDHASDFTGDNLSVLKKTIHGFISFSLQTIDEIKSREGPAISAKRKYNLLAIVSLLVSTPDHISLSKEVVEHCCDILCDCLLSNDKEHEGMTGVVLGSFNKLSEPSELKVLRYATVYLLKKLVQKSMIEELPDEVFAFFTAIIKNDSLIGQEAQLYNNIIPACVKKISGTDSKDAASNCLLSMASKDALAFKAATARIDGEDRKVLEATMRDTVLKQTGVNVNEASNSKSQPSISLKSFS